MSSFSSVARRDESFYQSEKNEWKLIIYFYFHHFYILVKLVLVLVQTKISSLLYIDNDRYLTKHQINVGRTKMKWILPSARSIVTRQWPSSSFNSIGISRPWSEITSCLPWRKEESDSYIQTFLHWHFSIEDQLLYCRVQTVRKYMEPS